MEKVTVNIPIEEYEKMKDIVNSGNKKTKYYENVIHCLIRKYGKKSEPKYFEKWFVNEKQVNTSYSLELEELHTYFYLMDDNLMISRV